MRAWTILVVLSVVLAGAAVCGPATALDAATPQIEPRADVCDDRPPLPAAPPVWPDALAIAPVAIEVRPDLAGAPVPLAPALTPRSAPTRAVPLRL